MNGFAWRERLGERLNTSPANNASWVMAVFILAVAIPASDKVAANQVFFAAHGVSSMAWVLTLAGGLAVGWLLVFGLLRLLMRLLAPAAYDAVTSLLMLGVTWFFVGNALSLTVFSGAPVLGPIVGLVAALAITLLSRRFAMGNALAVFAAAAAAIPLVLSAWSGGQGSELDTFAFAEQPDRPSVLWVVSDELQYPLALTQDGEVRPEFPNLRALQEQSTTYSRAYSGANYTDYAVPSMLTGISDVAAQGTDRMQDVRAGLGIVPGLSSEYSIVMESPIYSFDCDSETCASVGSGDDVGTVQRYLDFAKDTAAIAGRTALAPPFSDFFPSLDGKWRDFWAGGDEFGDDAEGDSVGTMISGLGQARSSNPGAPYFGFWHTIRTHAPWNVDRQGEQIFPSRVPIVEGAHMVGSEADQTYSSEELKQLQRRLYADATVDFDRQLGLLVDDLKASGEYDNTMIVVTSDHGATMTERADRRVGDTVVQRWSEVAHVPLIVKAPGQTAPELVAAPRSTGQIAASVLAAAGATPTPGMELSPSLADDLDSGPVFTTIAGGVLTPWVYSGQPEVDPWRGEDLTPPDPAHPYAVGVDPALIGGPVPTGWVQVGGARVETLPGESSQQVVIVDRDPGACPTEASVGLVTSDGTVVGSVLWEGARGSTGGETRGWAIVPKADPVTYAFWCPVA